MAVPTYSTDLATISLCDAVGTWVEPGTWTSGGTPAADTENFVQGTAAISKAFNATGIGGMIFDYGSGITITSPAAVFAWLYWASPKTLYNYADGGIRIMRGSSNAAFYGWDVGGKDYYTYGGWINEAVDVDQTVVTPDDTISTPSTTKQWFGAAFYNSDAISKGSPCLVDAFRYGREFRVVGGESANYGTFVGAAAKNDANDATDGYNRWGLFQAITAGYLMKGLFIIGYGGVADFRDSNRNIVIQNTRKVAAAFNGFEIRNASSRVDWTNINITALGTVSKGTLTVVDDADVNFASCVFTDMNTFVFKAASAVLSSTFRRCNTITANDANFTGTVFDASSAAVNTSQLIWDVATNPSSDLTGCSFTKGALAHHAIEFGTSSPTAITLTNMTFTGFNASNSQNDSALHFKRTSGTITVTLSGTGQPSYKAEGTTTVEWVTSSRTVKVAVTSVAGPVTGANVMLLAADGGPFPYNDTVTITRSLTTATVAHTGHGMVTNDQVLISGITDKIADNIPHTITRTSDDAYTFTTTDSGSTSYTGTIKCTFVFLKGIADAGTSSNEISMSRSIPSTQPVTGWARKASGVPYYKQGIISGNVVSTGDTTFSPVLILDA